MAYRSIPEPIGPFQLGEFFLEDRRFPAVYFLISNGVIVYVGQSRTLKWRIETHLTEGKKVFDAISFIPCTVDRLLQIEGHFIRRIAPKYNNCSASNAVRTRQPWRFPRRTDKAVLVREEAAEFVGLTVDQLLAIPVEVLPWRKKRRPRSQGSRALYHVSDLEHFLATKADLLSRIGTSEAKRRTRHRNHKAA